MNKTILTILVFCFAVFSVSAQKENTKTTTDSQKSAVEQTKIQKEKTNNVKAAQADQANLPAENPNAPVIEFDKMIHDYGTLAYNSDGNCEFKFTNTGKEPLILHTVKASWGCTIPAWPKDPVLPGKSEVIVVRYNTKKVGTINKSITVTSNATEATIRLKIKGRVEAAPAASVPENNLKNSGAPVKK